MSRLVVVALLMGFSGLIACDKINSLTDVPDKMDDLRKKIGDMDDGLRKAMTLQELGQSFDTMVNADNTLVPDNPASFVDAANVIADNASALQLVEIVKMKLLKIRNYTPDDSSKHCTLKFEEEGPDHLVCDQPTDLIDKLVHQDKAIITGLEAILMQVSQEKIEAMVNAQVPSGDFPGGLYEDWVYPALAFRAMGIWGYMWTVGLSDRMNNLAQLEEAVKLADSVEYIMRKPYLDKIALRDWPFPDDSTVTYDANDPNLVNAPLFWSQIHDAMSTPEFKKRLNASTLGRYNELLATVNARMQGWSAKKK